MNQVIDKVMQWRKHVTQQASSGISRKQYCEQHQLNYDHFGYYAKKLKQSVKPQKEWVPIQVVSSASSLSQTVIHLPNGIKIELQQALTSDMLNRLLSI